MKIVCVVGARPNFVKIAPLLKAFKSETSIESTLIHTGQHYDKTMSDTFFEDLKIGSPEVHFNVGSASHITMIAKVMMSAEEYFLSAQQDLIVVVGDVNSTLAIALAGTKLGIPIAHVEAGLRSNNWSMPEESNRVLTDRLSDLLFTPTEGDSQNLIDEGIDKQKIHMVGNIMIDTLYDGLKAIGDGREVFRKIPEVTEKYILVTLHRPECVDNIENLSRIIDAFESIQKKCPIIWPMHPRTKITVKDFGLESRIEKIRNLIIIEPLGYYDFLSLMKNSFMVLTDSGGIQEETTVLGIPCLTLRQDTERPITVSEGTNKLVGLDLDRIIDSASKLLDDNDTNGKIPNLWDGNTSNRITEIILSWFSNKS